MQQLCLTNVPTTNIPAHLPVIFIPHWLAPAAADALYQSAQQLPWHTESITIAGKSRTLKRRTLWMAKPFITYCYSGITHTPIAWQEEWLILCNRLVEEYRIPFNSVLGNYYPNGQAAMGYHQDNEPELGEKPTIASLSLGAMRRFRFRHLHTGEKVTIDLTHGSLLVMHGDCQRNWQHSLPVSVTDDLRINFTFRHVNARMNSLHS